MNTQETSMCPSCGYEYEPWVEVCPDCNVPVELHRPQAEGEGARYFQGDPQWTVVTNVPNAIIGNLIKSQLEDAGIPVLMFRSPSADVAQFSHNDYVPYDLRVPLEMVSQARQLIDSAPGNAYGPQPWNTGFSDDYEDGDEENEQEQSSQAAGSELPGGWSLLPTEADVRARQRMMRTHGEALKGWYWSDESEGPARDLPPSSYQDDYLKSDAEPYPPDAYRSPAREHFSEEDEGGDWYRSPQWIKVVYGVLLLAISLPFILQILEQLWNLLNFSR